MSEKLTTILQEIDSLKETLRQKKAEHRGLLAATADPVADSNAIAEKDKELKKERDALLTSLASTRVKAFKELNRLIDAAKTVEEVDACLAHLKALSLPQGRAFFRRACLNDPERLERLRVRKIHKAETRRRRRQRRLVAILKMEAENRAKKAEAAKKP